MDKIIAFLSIAALIGVILLIGQIMEHNLEKMFRVRLKKEFKSPLDKEYSRDRIRAMTGYYEHHRGNRFCLDDITWNDLGLDQFYRRFNHSYSSVGDEYMYYRLRVPALNDTEGDFQRLEELVKLFGENEKVREDLQVMLSKLGRSRKYSLYSYLDILSDVKQDAAVLTILDWIVYVALVVLMFFTFYPGLVLLIVWIICNVFAYLFRKRKIEPYFVCFEYILRLLRITGKCIKYLPDDFAPEKKILKEAKSKLNRISTGNLVFLQSDTTSALGDVGNALLNFIKMFFHIDLFLFFRMKKQVEEHADAVDTIFETLGKMDFAVNIASYRAILPTYCIPEFRKDGGIHTAQMVHPLLLDDGVPNSIDADGGILLTGSNASGKSTFLRMIGLNSVLAQSMHTVFAKEYSGEFYRVYTSMSLKDSLETKESYYMAEIRSIKRILDALQQDDVKVLCFVDEVLRGTNTKERIAAGAEIMRSMQGKNSICFAATHDIELAHMLPPFFTNYHFDEELEENDIHFPYQLKEGYATSRNAIALLRIMGYPEEIVERATKTVTESGN